MMKKQNISLLLIMFCWVLVLFPLCLSAQTKPAKFRNLTTSEGLSQNRVFSITQDHDGFIWIGTEDGLNRYDGYNFEIFKRVPGDSTSLADNFSTSLFVSKDGTLWIGGNFAGLSRYNAANKTFVNFSHIHSNPNSIAGNFVRHISEDEKGNLWVTTENNGFDYMVVNEGKFIHMENMLPKDYPLDTKAVYFVYQDKSNHLWIGSDDKLHYFRINYNNTGVPQLQPIKLANQNIAGSFISVKEDQKKEIYFGTTGKGLFKFNSADQKIESIYFNTDKSIITGMDILAIESDPRGNIWFGGTVHNPLVNSRNSEKSYLFKMNKETGSLQKFSHDPKDENSISADNVLSLFCDETGVLWIGTDLNGVNIYDESLTKFAIYVAAPDQSTKLSSPTRGFYLEKGNVLWIASQGDGLVSYDRTNQKFELYKSDPNDPTTISSNFVQSLYDDGQYLWVGTFSGLNRFDKRTRKFKRFMLSEDGSNIRINYNILKIDDYPDYLWFGTNGNGLIRFNKKDFTYKNYKYDPEVDNSSSNRANFVRVVWHSDERPDELWMGTTNGINIQNLKTEKYRYYDYDPNDSTSISYSNVMHFYEDNDGYIWIATYGGGLNRFDPKTKKFLRFTEENSNIPNNGVYGSLPDNKGNLWISTNNGITKFNTKTFKFRNYTVDDGLQSEEFNGGSFHLGYNGEMFFGGINGFNSFFPDKVIDNKFIPKIVITDFKIFNESITPGKNSPLTKEISKTDEINLEYWQNDISFGYVALHYSNPSKNKYAFKLENYEDDWRFVNHIRVATYTNLDPGEYIFRVKGSNNDGLWNDEGKSIKVIIHPPWWKTNTAYASYAFIFLFGVLSLDRFQKARIKRIEQRKAQLALLQAENERKTQELEAARNLQLSMLPKSLPKLPNLDIAVYMKTATEVGGDYYDFHVHLDGTLTVVLGDATGHGMQSGMMVSIMKSLFMADRSSKELKAFFNNSSDAIKDMHLGRIMMAFACVQFKEDQIIMANAGMPSFYIYKNSTSSVEEIAINDFPLGAMRDFDYQVKSEKISKGDTLLLMSDGLPELQNINSNQYGYEKVKNVFEQNGTKSSEEIVDLLKNESKEWIGNRDPEDDITFVVIKIK